MLPRIVGHRGAAAVAPENTLAGFRAAAAAGAPWVEFDTRLARDGTAVVIHDPRLDRTTDGHGRVREWDAEALRRLDAGGWFAPAFRGEPLPTLADALAECHRLGLGANVELKADRGGAAELARAVAAVLHGRLPEILLSSFSRPALAACAALMPERPRGYLAKRLPRRGIAEARTFGCVSIHLGARELTEAAARAVRRAGFTLAIYTVNELATARRFVAWGAQSIITDRPGDLAPLQTGEVMH